MKHPVAILVNPVRPGRFLLGRHAACDGTHWVFVHDGSLFQVPCTALAVPEAGLDQADHMPTPPGTVQGVLGFDGRLLLAVRQGQEATVVLYERWDKASGWLPAGTMRGRIGPWCRSPDGRTAFMVEDPFEKLRPDPRLLFVAREGEPWRPFEHIWLTEAEHVHSLCCIGEDLLLLVGDAHFRHFRMRVLDGKGRLLDVPAARHRLPLGLEQHSLYRIMPSPGTRMEEGLLFAKDGITELLDAKGHSVLRDTAQGACGFQVAAHACFPFARDLLFCGTWRRSQDAPYPCLYIIGPNGLYKYIEAGTPFRPDLAWTGYQDMDASLFAPALPAPAQRFWPCHAGNSLCLTPVTASVAARLHASGIPRLPPPDRQAATLQRLPVLVETPVACP